MPDALFGSQDSLDRDDLAAALPEPLPEEPASLRDDIVDELADHLRLSLDRELVNTGDEATARRRVLDRFGDPRTVARKLWWDALKGRIMRNRLWNIGLALLLVATIGSVLLMANLLRSMQAAQAELMDANRAAQEALVRQLGELQRKMAPESSTANTQPFAVRVVSSVDKRPIAAECVALVEVPGRPKQPLQVIRRTDATGLADFGHLPRGIMRFTVQGDDGWGYEAAEMFLGPNIPAVEEVRYPDTSPERTGSVRLHTPIPPEFDGLPLENLRFLAQLEGPREVLDGHEWWLGGRTNPDEARSLHKRTQFSVRFDAQGTALNVTEIGTHSAESGAENRELSSVPGRLPVGDYLVTSIAAFHADAMTQPEQRASVVMNSELSRRLQVEPQAVSPIELPETMLGPLWLSIQSLPLWPRDRPIDLTVRNEDVGHAEEPGLRGGEQPGIIGVNLPLVTSPPRLKTGDHVSVKFDVFPKPDFAETWPHGDAGAEIGFDGTGLCYLRIESIHQHPSRVRILVNRFQEGWYKALVSCQAGFRVEKSLVRDIEKINGFGKWDHSQTMARFLKARLAQLPPDDAPVKVDPVSPPEEDERQRNQERE